MSFNLIVLNTTNLPNSFQFHSIQTSFKDIIFAVLKSGVWSNTFTDWFKKCSDGYIFSNPTIQRIGEAPNILCPRCRKLFKCNLVSLLVFSESARPVSLLVPGVNNNVPPYSDRFKSLIYTKKSSLT